MKKILMIFWKENVFLLFLMLGAGLSTTVVGFLNAWILDSLVKLNMRQFLLAIICMLGTFSIFLLFTYWKINQQSKTMQKMTTYLRVDLMKKLSKTDYCEFHKQKVGTYASWMTNDLNQIEQMGFFPFYALVEGTINSILAAIALFFLHWSLLLLCICEVLLLLLIPKIFEKKMGQTGQKVADANETFLENATDCLSAYDTISVFQRFPFLIQKIKHFSLALADAKNKEMKLTAIVAVVGGIGNVCGQISVYALTGILVLHHILMVGYIMTTGSFSSTIFNMIGNISQNLASIASVHPLFEKYETIVISEKTGADSFELTQGYQIDHLSYRYQDHDIFEDLDFQFLLGKKYAISGASGSGKSTLLNILAGRLPYTAGTIDLGNQELSKLSTQQIYQHVLYIDQHPHIFNGTLRENLEMGESFSDEELWIALEKADLKVYVEKLPQQLDSEVGEGGRSLSGGQCQRLSLARGLLRKKNIILLDEGTANLDKASALQIEKMLVCQKELTVIMVTHHLHDEIRRSLDDILYLT